MRNSVAQVFEFMSKLTKEERLETKKHIVECLLDVDTEVEEGKAREYAEYVVNKLENKGKQLRGKSTMVAFSSKEIQCAMLSYLRCKAAFKDQRSTCPDVLPIVTTLKKIQTAMQVKEGINPKVYGWFFDEYINGDMRNEDQIPMGHIIQDQMKLNNTGYYFRASDNQACGLAKADDTMDL